MSTSAPGESKRARGGGREGSDSERECGRERQREKVCERGRESESGGKGMGFTTASLTSTPAIGGRVNYSGGTGGETDLETSRESVRVREREGERYIERGRGGCTTASRTSTPASSLTQAHSHSAHQLTVDRKDMGGFLLTV